MDILTKDSGNHAMNGKLHLITIDSPSQEQELLRELTRYPGVAASRVAPAYKFELSALNVLAHRCQREVVVSPFSRSAVETLGLDAATDDEDVPDLLVVGTTVEPSLKQLAGALCRRRAVSPDELIRGEVAFSRGSTCLFLWSPDSTPLSTMLTALEALAERDVRIGLLPCFGADSDRWALIKALSFPVLPNRGKYRVLSPSLRGANAPGCVGAADHEVPSVLREPLDFLAFVGHGNPQDIFVGRHAIMCARQGFNTQSTPGSGLFPCYHDGVCFRQAFRLPDAELLEGESLNALLLFAVTCYYVHLGKSPFLQSSGIVPRVMRGNMVATISSPGIVWANPAILVLGLCLIHEGWRLADVARALDRLQRETLGLSTGLPRSIPSIALFGNPCARLQSFGLTDANILARENQLLVSQAPASTSGQGAFLRIALEGAERSIKTWSIEGLPQGAWAHGARLEDEAGERLYVWLGEQAVKGLDALRLAPLNRSGVERETINSCIEALDFWPLFLDYCVEVREGRNADTEPLERALKTLPRWRRRLAKLLMSAAPQHAAVVVDGKARFRAVMGRALAHMRECSTTLLNLCADVLAYDGFSDIGIYIPLLNAQADLTSGRCACAQSELRTHQWVSFSGARPEAYRHACPCASGGQDSCRYDIVWASSPPSVRLSETLRLSLNITAPSHHYLFIEATAILVRPTHDRRISGPVVELLLAPGEKGELTCDVHLPTDLPLGLHEVSILAIVNGALVQRCYMIELRAADHD